MAKLPNYSPEGNLYIKNECVWIDEIETTSA